MTTEAPEYTERDDHNGPFTRVGIPAHMHAATFTAAEIAANAAEGVIWESVGHNLGREVFARSRYIANAAGDLHVYAADGHKVLIHPAARKLRVLAR